MTVSTPTAPAERATRSRAGRIVAMSRAEMLLLWRNKTAMFTALALPVFLVLFVYSMSTDEGRFPSAATFLPTALAGFVLLFVVYYNLVSAYVARREELVLKRLRTSEATDAEILLATAVPAVALALAQLVLGIAAVAVLLGLEAPVNPLLAVVAVVGGTAVLVLLAAASAPFTKSVEMAQVTTLPVLLVSMLFSGLIFPLDTLPEAAANAARLLPLTPVVDLLQLGLQGAVGTDSPVGFAETFGEAAGPAGVLLAWVLIGVYAIRRWFRWEPRV